MVRNHLVYEWCLGAIGACTSCHSCSHGTVHRINTMREFINTSLFTHEFSGTLSIWKLEVCNPVSSARLIVCSGPFVIIRDLGIISRLKHVTSFINPFDFTTHVLVDVAKVNDVFREVSNIKFKSNLIFTSFLPVPRTSEKLGFVNVKTKIFITIIRCDLINVTVLSKIISTVYVHGCRAGIIFPTLT